MGRGKVKSFRPAGKDKVHLGKKKNKKGSQGGIIRGRVESAKTERKRLKRVEHQLKTIAQSAADGDAIMQDLAEQPLTKAQKKKLKRKEENQKVILVEEEVKNQMAIDTSAGTELGAPL